MSTAILNTGVYCIRNVFTGEEYIGSALRSFRSRWNRHKLSLSRGEHHNWFMQAAWNFFGPNVFEMNILERCEKAVALKQEQKWMTVLKPEYNICKWAGCPNSGTKWSEERRATHIERFTGEKNPFFGRKHDTETIAHMSAIKRGKVYSLESRAKVSESLIGNKRTLGSTWYKDPITGKRIYSKKEDLCPQSP